MLIYQLITETLQNHLDPIPNIIAERYRFYKREQMETESVSDYIAAIKKLSTKCDFKIFLNEALRDKLVCGLKDRTMQERLMSMKDLTFKHACTEAVTLERATTDVKLLKGTADLSLNHVAKPRSAM